MKYLINETFTSLQGEGVEVGKKAFFIRFYRCNLDCKWCDTNYARFGGEAKPYSPEQLLELTPSNIPLILTGGEPMLYSLRSFLTKYFRREGRKADVEIETNGTIFDNYYYTKFTVSPKLAYINDDYEESLIKFEDTHRATFKFVVETKREFDETIKLKNELALSNVLIMPKGYTLEEQLENSRNIAHWLIDDPRELNIRLVPRLHILMWGNTRGK